MIVRLCFRPLGERQLNLFRGWGFQPQHWSWKLQPRRVSSLLPLALDLDLVLVRQASKERAPWGGIAADEVRDIPVCHAANPGR